MLHSAVHTFFAIPELFVLLSIHVHRGDLPRCMRVCKAWSQHFEPILWRDLTIYDRTFDLMKNVARPRLTRNLYHTRALKIDRANDAQLSLLVRGLPYDFGRTVSEPGVGCTNLKSLTVFALDEECLEYMSRPLVTLLDYNPHLTRLKVSFDIFQIDGVLAALSKLHHLQQLDIQTGVHDDGAIHKPHLFLQSCLALPQLTSLTFHRDLSVHWSEGDESTAASRLKAIINEASIARFSQNPSAKRLKLLRLPISISGNSNPLPLLLLKSNLLDLETCETPWFQDDANPWEIEQVVREHCPNLKHLECPQFFETDHHGLAARAFIRGCSGLRSFTSAYFVDCPDYAPPRFLLSDVVTHHHTTLEVLELTDPVQVFSRDLQRALSQCKQLQRFWVMGDSERSHMPGIDFSDISRSDWACTELQELGVILNRYHSRGDATGDLGNEEQQDDASVWLTASTTKRVYQQIGQLKKLRSLAIDIERNHETKAKEQDYMWDLTLRKGWLGELAGLKNLRSFMLRADFWSCMGQEDVEFMHKHWPLLNEIVISSDIPEFYLPRHWQWLRDKRPNLLFRSEEMY